MRAVQFSPQDEGVWFACQRGIYIGEAIQEAATRQGWKGETLGVDGEFYSEATDEAENYLQDLASDGYYFGTKEGCCCWGMFQLEELDDLI